MKAGTNDARRDWKWKRNIEKKGGEGKKGCLNEERREEDWRRVGEEKANLGAFFFLLFCVSFLLLPLISYPPSPPPCFCWSLWVGGVGEWVFRIRW